MRWSPCKPCHEGRFLYRETPHDSEVSVDVFYFRGRLYVRPPTHEEGIPLCEVEGQWSHDPEVDIAPPIESDSLEHIRRYSLRPNLILIFTDAGRMFVRHVMPAQYPRRHAVFHDIDPQDFGHVLVDETPLSILVAETLLELLPDPLRPEDDEQNDCDLADQNETADANAVAADTDRADLATALARHELVLE